MAGILEGRDCLGIMPTGGGKSICYQLPSLLLDGVTLVVSPLISLIKDQVDVLNSMGIPAAFINSTMTSSQIDKRCGQILHGDYKIVYIAPERLESERFLELISRIRVPLIAVDEAHCISQWGHDFRPSYMNISRMVQHLAERPIIAAFTATATDKVMNDIAANLRMKSPRIVRTGYSRDNLAFSVVKGESKKEFLHQYIFGNKSQSGILYASTRKEVDLWHQQLLKWGVQAGKYHAGMPEEERSRNQEMFLFDDLKVMVATNAFGMGIDKSNVRYVIHLNLPKKSRSLLPGSGPCRKGRGRERVHTDVCAAGHYDAEIFLIEQSGSDPGRQNAEYGNLKKMIDYCHTSLCLQKVIVQYFGDFEYGECGKCSNCTDDKERVNITTEAQKIFFPASSGWGSGSASG